MSVTVKHLNADSSFLLTFSPDAQPSPPSEKSPSATYSILIDPWVRGDSVVTAPWFAITKRIIPACINHLSELDEPDIILVSQNKPDHCHEETLRQLRPDGKTIIAAEPGAARAIKSWDHFDPARVLALPKFNPQKKFSCATFYIPPLSPGGHRGVVTISFIPAKNYVTGLHNAIGITYLAPTHTRAYASVPTVDLQKKTHHFQLPLSPSVSHFSSVRPLTASSAASPDPSLERPLTAGAGAFRPRLSQNFSLPMPRRTHSPPPPVPSPRLPYTPPPIFSREDDSPTSTFSSYSRGSASTDSSSLPNSPIIQTIPNAFTTNKPEPLPTPPQSPAYANSSSTQTSTSTTKSIFQPVLFSPPAPPTPRSSTSSTRPSPPFTTTSTITAGRPRPLSIIYTPHGIPFSPDLQPYITSHLVPRGALPLTILFHAFSRATNPWYFGGNITTGVPGGVEIARGLMARVWISAHDEDKDDQGISVKRLRKECMRVEEVRRRLFQSEMGSGSRSASSGGDVGGWVCDVRSLGTGESMAIGQERDLCVGMGLEGKNRESRLLRFSPPPGPLALSSPWPSPLPSPVSTHIGTSLEERLLESPFPSEGRGFGLGLGHPLIFDSGGEHSGRNEF